MQVQSQSCCIYYFYLNVSLYACVRILTTTFNPRSIRPEMGLTPLRGGDGPSYKHSSYFTVRLPPLGVRVLLQGFPPLRAMTTQLRRWGIPHSKVNANPTPQSGFPLLGGITCKYRTWDSPTREPRHPPSPKLQSISRTRLSESWSTFHGGNQFQKLTVQ